MEHAFWLVFVVLICASLVPLDALLLGKRAGYAGTRGCHKAAVGCLQDGSWQRAQNPLAGWNGVRGRKRRLITGAKHVHLRGRNPRGKQVYPSTDVLRHAQSCGQGVDGASRMGENGKLGDLQRLADGINII